MNAAQKAGSRRRRWHERDLGSVNGLASGSAWPYRSSVGWRINGSVRSLAARHHEVLMKGHRLLVNGIHHDVDVDADTPLLWVLRDSLGLTGTKFGCGIGACGACTVHVDGIATRSCQLPVNIASGKAITTIEGLERSGGGRLQEAWLLEDVAQCGYCQ